LFMAERLPAGRITAVSNAAPQRLFIDTRRSLDWVFFSEPNTLLSSTCIARRLGTFEDDHTTIFKNLVGAPADRRVSKHLKSNTFDNQTKAQITSQVSHLDIAMVIASFYFFDLASPYFCRFFHP